MNLKPGDYVVHPAYGVGTIVTIEEMGFAEKGSALFYRVDFDKTTVWVPVQVQQNRGMRPITPKSELVHYRAVLKSSPILLSDNFRTRQVELEARMKQSSFQNLCEIVRDLSARGGQKHLNSYESSLLKRTRSFLLQEWAFICSMSVEEAAQEVDAFIAEGKRNFPLPQHGQTH